jgi:hypothetical protein
MDRKTEIALQQLRGSGILLGGWRRRKGAKALSGTDEPDAVDSLVSALDDSDEKVRATVLKIMTTLRGKAVDRFCKLWAETRKCALESVFLQCGYVASNPHNLHILTLLKNGKDSELVNTDSSGVDVLLGLLRDKDSAIAAGAERVLVSLRQEKTINYFCKKWEEDRDSLVEQIILKACYIATHPADLRYLTLLKQGRLEDATNSDKEGILLLISFLKEPDPVVRENARIAIHSLQRQESINEFAAEADEEGVSALLQLLSDNSLSTSKRAYLALSRLKRREAINRLCGVWTENRDPTLKDIILRANYIASEPLVVHALTSFLSGKQPQVVISGEIVKFCLLDKDDVVARNAVDYVVDAKGDATANWLLPFLVQKLDFGLFQALNKAGWYPAEATDRALFFFLAGDLEKYHDIDFEQNHLRYWYETAGPELKAAIAAGIRDSGQRRLLAVFRTERGGRKQRMTVGEVELQIEILTSKQDFAGLFGLLAFATYEQGMRIMQAVQAAGWQSPDSHTRDLQQRLDELMKAHGERRKPFVFSKKILEDFRPMFMGSEKPPSDGPGLSAWLADQNSFRRRSAALITMTEGNLPGLKEAAGKASADAYWQVRMAAAACELLQPGTLSAENRTLLENDHVYWVRAVLKMVEAERLVELDPAGLENLRQRGDKRDPKEKPEGPDDFFGLMPGPNAEQEREYLLTLGEFLGTDVVVSDETTYEADVSDIEIEVEK